MSLRDDLESIQMTQTRNYKEEQPKSSGPTESSNEPLNDAESSGNGGSNRKTVDNPFKRNTDGEGGSALSGLLGNKKLLFGGGGLIAVIIVVALVLSNQKPEDEGADFLTELEQAPAFQYTVEERETLRLNGYTADDIERYQVEERDPYSLVEEATEKRKALLDEEMKPLLDGASPKYKQLEAMTWLGTGTMSQQVLANAEGSYEERFGTYNCDYTKVEAHGAQLFVKLILKEFNNQAIFMTVTPTRYNELDKSGNIVVVIEYNKYTDGSILVTDVQEKDIVN